MDFPFRLDSLSMIINKVAKRFASERPFGGGLMEEVDQIILFALRSIGW
jgi:hypothetical protein